MNSLIISNEELSLVAEILKSYLSREAKVFIFGSRAKGKASKFSDLDIAIDQNQLPLDFIKIAELKDAFDESDLPYKVDVIDLNVINDEFKTIVDEHKVPFNF